MSSDAIREAVSSIRPVADAVLEAKLRARLDSLTKPPGSLGRLEETAIRVGLIQRTAQPRASRKVLFVCCADHGVTAEGVSPFPQEVTRQMVANFVRGGAAINVLCRQFDIQARVLDCGVKSKEPCGALDFRIGNGTANFAAEPAMSRAQAERAVATGIQIAADAAESFDLLAAGEMGIGNTTAAAALFSALSGFDPDLTAGRGTGLDDPGIVRKREVIRRALALHRPDPADPLGVLAAVGGFEIGVIAGLILGAARSARPIVMDGFITCSAALVARALCPASLDAVIWSHRSAEQGHRRMLEFLNAAPLLDLDMRLGEGSGAATGVSLVESAVRLYSEMATFAEAAVSNQATS